MVEDETMFQRMALVALVLAGGLAGCSRSALPLTAAGLRSQAVQANSLAGAKKGVAAMFKSAFSTMDLDKDGVVTNQEFAGAARANVATMASVGLMATDFMALDGNKDGKVSYREFARPEVVNTALKAFRHQVGVAFATLDLNGDRILTPEELIGSRFSLEMVDLNKNQKVTLSEFEDGFAATFGGGVEPPAQPGDPAPAPVAGGGGAAPAPVAPPAQPPVAPAEPAGDADEEPAEG